MSADDWKSVSESAISDADAKVAVRKRRPMRLRETPHFFIPRRSLPYTVAYYSAWIAAGIGAGMLTEIWINKKIKDDGGVIWEFDK